MYNYFAGLSPDIQQQTKIQAWGAILGIGVGVAIIALVILIIVKRRNYRDFSHRKLVEDMPSDPGNNQLYIILTHYDL